MYVLYMCLRQVLLLLCALTSALHPFSHRSAAASSFRCGAVTSCSVTSRRRSSQRQPAPPPPPGVERQKKRHALLLFGYTGTGFYGLQGQGADGDPEKPAVSDLIRRALLDSGFIQPTNWAPLTRTKWLLASRTDKGVHAVCAAASCMLETVAADVEEGAVLGAAEGVKESDRASNWQLSASALARINARLPEEVRLFGGVRVRKKFNARECASSRSYEYLLPAAFLGGA